MPYTPPSTSPVVTTPSTVKSCYISSPPAEKKQLQQQRPQPQQTLCSPPKSATYMYKHRRAGSVDLMSPLPMSNYGYRPASSAKSMSLRQSPPPVSDPSAMIPRTAILSPPDSSDDEANAVTMAASRHSPRRFGQVEAEDLKRAIEAIPQRRSLSPPDDKFREPTSEHDSRIKALRKKHVRSSSENCFEKSSPRIESNAVSDTEDDAYRIAPPMVRKKSGEIVRSSLKHSNTPRPASMPSTPTYPKVVHFDQHLEHVRHFQFTEKPSAVSAGSSPVDPHDGEREFPFDAGRPLSPPFEMEINTPNFPKDLEARKSLPVRVERVYLSADKSCLMGCVAVANLAFQKTVVVRFTFDYWRTVSEVTAEYNTEFRRRHRDDGIDRFTFSIQLSDISNLENRVMFFCVRYSAAGQEHWDNNSSFNFQVDFKKKHLPQNGKPGLERSSSNSRPLARSASSNDITPMARSKTERARPKPQIDDHDENAIPVRKSATNAFGNRYDFDTSLNATISAAKPEDQKVRKPSPERKNARPEDALQRLSISSVAINKPLASTLRTGQKSGSPAQSRLAPKPSMESLSYRELIDNYCFFGSARTSPDNSYTDLATLHSLTLPKPPTHSFRYDLSPKLDWPVSPAASPPPGLSPSESSGESSPVMNLPANYNYQKRRHGGGVGGFAPAAGMMSGTAITG